MASAGESLKYIFGDAIPTAVFHRRPAISPTLSNCSPRCYGFHAHCHAGNPADVAQSHFGNPTASLFTRTLVTTATDRRDTEHAANCGVGIKARTVRRGFAKFVRYPGPPKKKKKKKKSRKIDKKEASNRVILSHVLRANCYLFVSTSFRSRVPFNPAGILTIHRNTF